MGEVEVFIIARSVIIMYKLYVNKFAIKIINYHVLYSCILLYYRAGIV